MKKIHFITLIVGLFLITTVYCEARIEAPPGTTWGTANGKTFMNGEVADLIILSNGYRIFCSDSQACCWEISGDGRYLDIYAGIFVPAKPGGDLGPSVTDVFAEPINPVKATDELEE